MVQLGYFVVPAASLTQWINTWNGLSLSPTPNVPKDIDIGISDIEKHRYILSATYHRVTKFTTRKNIIKTSLKKMQGNEIQNFATKI